MNFRIRIMLAALLISGIPSGGGAVELSVIDRTLLVEAQVLGKSTLSVVIATGDGANARVADGVAKAGGSVLTRQDDIGYLLVSLPVIAVQGFTHNPDLVALQLVTNPVRAEAGPEDPSEAVAASKKGPPPGPWLQADNPYTGESATQASLFKSLHPEWNGRGVTLGFVEPADPALPSMRGALDLQGHVQSKYADFDIGPSEHSGPAIDSTHGVLWQSTEAVRPAADGTVRIGEHVYRLPLGVVESQWRLCLRLPKPGGWDKESWTLLWGVSTRKVWIVPASARDFTNAVVTEVSAPYFVAKMGQRTSDTADRGSLSWVMKADESHGKLGVMPTYARHPAMVASVMAGDSFLGSAAGGVAPAAQLSVFDHGWPEEWSPQTFENQLAMLRSTGVDVAEASAAVADTARGGGNVYALLEHRLQRLTKKPFAKAQGNFGPHRNGVDEMTASSDTFSIGGYVPRETWKANFGFEPSAAETPAEYSGWGPAQDGTLKPDFMALTGTLDESEYRSTGYETPYGLYGVSGGTSAAAPNGAGLIALLVSAAKQTNVPYDVGRLRAALASTTKFLPDLEARVQGRGLIQINDAWGALQRAGRWEPPEFSVEASLVAAERGEAGHSLKVGNGLFEMGGWSPGRSGQRTITIVRKSGPAGSVTYRLRWHESVHQHGTPAFSSDSKQIALPLNQRVELPVRIRIGAAGSYSAIVDLIDPAADLVALSIMNTVLVGEPLSRACGYTARITGVLERPGNAVAWIEVPAGLSALNVRVGREDGRDFYLMAQDPTGRYMPFELYGRVAHEAKAAVVNGRTVETIDSPVPGLWQFSFRERSNEIKPSAKRLTAVPWQMEFRGVQVEAQSPRVAGEGAPMQVVFSSHGPDLGAVRIQGLGLGSAHEEVIPFDSREEAARQFVIDVPQGTDRLEVEGVVDEPSARIGLYVYKKPDDPSKLLGDTTSMVYYDGSRESRKRYVLRHPPGGTYVIAIDPISVPAGGTRVRYRDVFFHSSFGGVSVSGGSQLMTAQGMWSAPVTVEVHARPTGDRMLVASAGLMSDGMGDLRKPEMEAEGPGVELDERKGAAAVVPGVLGESLWRVWGRSERIRVQLLP